MKNAHTKDTKNTKVLTADSADSTDKKIEERVRYGVTTFFPMCDGAGLNPEQQESLVRWIMQAIRYGGNGCLGGAL